MILNNLSILIAEDDFDDAEIIQESFLNNSHFSKVDVVKNGQELINYLKNCNACPHIILTDVNMPIMDGIEALEQISKDPVLSKIPCFVYSTSLNPTYEAKCDELGVKGFIVKPYTLEEFDNIPKEIITLLSKS